MMLTPRIPSRCRPESRMVFIPSNIPANLCKIGTIRNKTRLCALVLTFLFVSLNAGCREQPAEKSGTDRFFITPTSIDVTDNAFAVGSFHYTLPEEGGILSLSVEQWNGEDLISQQILPVPLSAGQSGEVTLRLTMEAMEGTDSRSVCWVGQSNAGKASVSLPVPWDLGVIYSFGPRGCCVVSDLDRSHPRGRHNSSLSGNWEPGARTAQSVL